MKIRNLLTFCLLIVCLMGNALTVEPIVKGNTENEQADYVLSRYLFQSSNELRNVLYEQYFENSNKELQALFSSYDSIRTGKYEYPEEVFQRVSNEKYSSAIQLLRLIAIAGKGNLDSALSLIEFPISLNTILDTAVEEYKLVLGAWIAGKQYDAEKLVHYSERLFNFRQQYLVEDNNYVTYRHLAYAYEKNEQIDSCLKYYELSKQIAEAQKDSAGLFIVNMDFGIYYSNLGQRVVAIEYFTNCEKYINSVSPKKQAIYHINSTIDYRVMQRHEMAESHLRKAHNIALTINDNDVLGHVYRNWVSQFGASGKLDSIPKYFQLSKNHFKSKNNLYGLGHLYIDYAHYFQEKQNFDSTTYWLDMAGNCFSEIGYERGHLTVAKNRFQYLYEFNRIAEAEDLGFWVLKENEKFKDEETKLDVLGTLSQILAKRGKYKQAYQFLDSAKVIQDTLEGQEAARKIDLMTLQLAKERAAKLEIQSQLEHQNLVKMEQNLGNQERLTFYALMGMFTILALFLVSVFFYFRMRKEKERVIKLSEQKDDLMNVVAHDILSPISKVSALAYLIRNTEDLEERNSYFDLIEVTLEDGAEMVKNLLDIHSAENNKLEVRYSNVLLSKLIEDALIGLNVKAEQKKIKIETKIVKDKAVKTDPRMMQRIIDNLVGNAIKFSPPSSTIKLIAKKGTKDLKIEIIDEGPGFSEKDREKMFQKFSKLSARPTGEEPSNGLGLAIVKELVQLLNGLIKLESEPDKGARFILTFPIGD